MLFVPLKFISILPLPNGFISIGFVDSVPVVALRPVNIIFWLGLTFILILLATFNDSIYMSSALGAAPTLFPIYDCSFPNNPLFLIIFVLFISIALSNFVYC